MWVCEAQAQGAHPAGVIAAYAVGIKDLKSDFPVPMRIVKATSTPGSQPLATADLIPGFVISGCGARVEPPFETAAPGPYRVPTDHQFVTAMFPNTSAGSANGPATECQAKASDYGASAPGTVSAYAINLLLDRDMLSRAYRDPGPAGSPLPTPLDEGPAGTTLILEGPRFSSDMKVQFVPYDVGVKPTPAPVIVSPWFPQNSVHRARVLVPSLPSGIYSINVLQGDVPGPEPKPLVTFHVN